MVKQNLGKTDRVLRFALAFWWLGPWALRFNTEWINWIVIFIGWIALIESFTGWCWLHTLFGINNKNQ
ncbi:MAG: DUF2892 domain-containing protein [Nanoarchaeota archaeon]